MRELQWDMTLPKFIEKTKCHLKSNFSQVKKFNEEVAAIAKYPISVPIGGERSKVGGFLQEWGTQKSFGLVQNYQVGKKFTSSRERKLALKERFEIGKTFRTFRSSPTIQTIEEIYLYTGSDLLADIGGYLGLLLGVSAFTLYTAMEDLLRAFKCKRHSCSQREEEKEPEWFQTIPLRWGLSK